MKTLNEKLYEYLVNAGKPINIGDILNDKEFSNVPQRLIGNGLLAIRGEGSANYYMKDGKMYFTTDLSQGHAMIGSQSFISSLSGVASNPLFGLLSVALKVFPEVGDAETDAALDAIKFTSKCKCDSYEIAFPSDPVKKIAPNNNETLAHDFVADYNSGPISKMTARTELKEEYELTRDARAEFIKYGLICYINKIAKCLCEPEEYVTDTAYALCLPTAPYCTIHIVRPDGTQVLRIDWNFAGKLPSKKAVMEFLRRWIDTYKYSASKQYIKNWGFDFDKVLKKQPNAQMRKQILKEIKTTIDKTVTEVSVFLLCATSEKAVKRPTAFLYNSRRILEKAAKSADELINCMTKIITFYSSENVSDDFLLELCSYGKMIALMLGNLVAKVNVGNAPYYSDDNSDGETVVYVRAIPSHLCDYVDFLAEKTLNIKSADSDTKTEIKKLQQYIKEIYDAENEEPDYNSEFEISEKTLVTYLGAAEDVTVPQNISSIGDAAFKNVRQVKTVTFGANVTAIGSFVFDGCSDLKTVKILGDPTSIGFFGNKAFTVQGYKDTEIEKYCKNNKIKFEALPEDDTPLIEISDSGAYMYEGFAFPKVIGCKEMNELDFLQKNELKENKGTSNIKFRIMSSDKSFLESSSARFSLSAGDPLRTSGDGIRQAMHLEQMSVTKTFHDKYSTVKADNGRVVVRYDAFETSENDGVRGTTYLFAVASNDVILPMFMIFNGNYSPKQQQAALESYAREIVTTKSYYEKVKKAQEQAEQKRIAEEKKAAEEKAKEQVKLNKPIVKQCLAQIDECKKSVKTVVAKKQKEEQESIQKEIEQLEAEKQSHKDALAKLGLFASSEKKAEKAEIERIEAEIAKISTSKYVEDQLEMIESCGNLVFEEYKEDVEDFLAKKYNMGYKQKEERKPLSIEDVNKKECDAMAADGKTVTDLQKERNLLKLQILDFMYKGEQGKYQYLCLITDLEDMLKNEHGIDIESMNYQKFASIVKSLVKDGFVTSQEIRRRVYYSFTDTEQKTKVGKRLRGLPMIESQLEYTENNYYANLKCPKLPTEKVLSNKLDKKFDSKIKSHEEKRIEAEKAQKEAKRQENLKKKRNIKILLIAVLIIVSIIAIKAAPKIKENNEYKKFNNTVSEAFDNCSSSFFSADDFFEDSDADKVVDAYFESCQKSNDSKKALAAIDTLICADVAFRIHHPYRYSSWIHYYGIPSSTLMWLYDQVKDGDEYKDGRYTLYGYTLYFDFTRSSFGSDEYELYKVYMVSGNKEYQIW